MKELAKHYESVPQSTDRIYVRDLIGDRLQLALNTLGKRGRAFPKPTVREDVEHIVNLGLQKLLELNYIDHTVKTNVLVLNESLNIWGKIDAVIETDDTVYIVKHLYANQMYTKQVQEVINAELSAELSLNESIYNYRGPKEVKLCTVRLVKDGSNRRKNIKPYMDFKEIDRVDAQEIIDKGLAFIKNVKSDGFDIRSVQQCSDLHFNGSAFNYPRPMKCLEECIYSANCPYFELNKWQKEQINKEKTKVATVSAINKIRMMRKKGTKESNSNESSF